MAQRPSLRVRRLGLPLASDPPRRSFQPGTLSALLSLVIATACPCAAAEVVSAPAGIELDAPESKPAEPEWFAWEVGTIADRDVTAAVPFSSIDPEESARAQADAAAAITPIYRFVPAVADQVAAELDVLIAGVRRDFQEAVVSTFGPLPLDAKAFLGDDFASFCSRWVDDSGSTFVPSAEHARKWAIQADDAAFVAPLRDALHTLLATQPIAESKAPMSATALADGMCRIVTTRTRDSAIVPDPLTPNVNLVPHDQLMSLAQAQERLAQSFPNAGLALAAWADLLRANTFFEEELTQRERVERARQVVAAPRAYAAGAVVVREGETIGPGTLAALADLRTAWSAFPPATSAPGADDVASVVVNPIRTGTATSGALGSSPDDVAARASTAWKAGWFMGVGAVLTVLGAILTWLIVRRRRASLVVAGTETGAPESPVVLALRESTVQSLFSQRQLLLADQDRSADRVTALEERIARLQPQFQARIRAYEARIQELESQLAEKRGRAASEMVEELTRLRRERDDHLAPGSDWKSA